MDKATKDTTLADILNRPGAGDVLLKYKVPCLGCPLVQAEMHELKIGDVAKMYKLDIKSLLKELNTLNKK